MRDTVMRYCPSGHGCHFAITLLMLACLGLPGDQARAETLVASGGDNYAPFHFVEDGQQMGFDVDLIHAVARTVGLDVDVQLAPWREARAGIEDGSVQIQVGMTISRDRQQQYRFASPHISQHYKIFVRAGTSDIRTERDLVGKALIVQRKGVMARYVVEQQYTTVPVAVANAEEALRRLAAGEGDACLMSELRGLYVIQKLGLKNIERVGEPVYQTFYSFAVLPEHENLIPRLNQGLTILKASGEYDRIYDKWFGVLDDSKLAMWDYLKYASRVIVPLALAFLLASLWSWSLQRRVVQQTRELRLARDQAEAASEAKSRFLATMSHEIRTPLNGVLGMAHILMTSRLDNEQAEQVETINKSARALQEIITDILDFSRIEAGGRVLESIAFSPSVLAHDVLGIIRPAALEKNLDLRLDTDLSLPEILVGDPTALKQILLNLLGNAVKFTNSGHVLLQLRAKRQAGVMVALTICVHDTGIGLPSQDRERLFDAFTQADSSTTRCYGGSGLGLAICHNLATMMGGRLTCQAGETGGSVFLLEVEMGAIVDSDADQEQPAVVSPAEDLKDLHVLLVEDNLLNQRVMGLLLKKYGVKMTIANDGLEALDECSGGVFDAIVMDCQMPRMDGFEATTELRRREEDRSRTPIIALTAGAFESDRERCLQAGMDDFLTKPVDGEVLLAVLRKWTAKQPEHTP